MIPDDLSGRENTSEFPTLPPVWGRQGRREGDRDGDPGLCGVSWWTQDPVHQKPWNITSQTCCVGTPPATKIPVSQGLYRIASFSHWVDHPSHRSALFCCYVPGRFVHFAALEIATTSPDALSVKQAFRAQNTKLLCTYFCCQSSLAFSPTRVQPLYFHSRAVVHYSLALSMRNSVPLSNTNRTGVNDSERQWAHHVSTHA